MDSLYIPKGYTLPATDERFGLQEYQGKAIFLGTTMNGRGLLASLTTGYNGNPRGGQAHLQQRYGIRSGRSVVPASVLLRDSS